MTTAIITEEVTDQYRVLWSRVYAPLRRALAGTWVKRDGNDSFSLTLDESGRFRLRCLATNTLRAGTYTIVARAESHYVALEPEEGEKVFLRLEDVDSLSMKVVQEETGAVLDLKKQKAYV